MILKVPPKEQRGSLTIWLTPRQLEKLTRIRAETGLSFGQVVRRLIDQLEGVQPENDSDRFK
jgi:hypothetical protein